jgi:hypothetical protein
MNWDHILAVIRDEEEVYFYEQNAMRNRPLPYRNKPNMRFRRSNHIKGKHEFKRLRPIISIQLNGKPALAFLDSGSNYNLLAKKKVLELGLQVEPTKIKLAGYTGDRINLEGQVEIITTIGPRSMKLTFQVVKEGHECHEVLIGLGAFMHLDGVAFHVSKAKIVIDKTDIPLHYLSPELDDYVQWVRSHMEDHMIDVEVASAVANIPDVQVNDKDFV